MRRKCHQPTEIETKSTNGVRGPRSHAGGTRRGRRQALRLRSWALLMNEGLVQNLGRLSSAALVLRRRRREEVERDV
ncbi:hypothetical protein GJAV_G00003430 [Gymnothorax javanicus]|nr:hypothetical protein GJAV_G00003430 [Gymnothorax javanicus]